MLLIQDPLWWAFCEWMPKGAGLCVAASFPAWQRQTASTALVPSPFVFNLPNVAFRQLHIWLRHQGLFVDVNA